MKKTLAVATWTIAILAVLIWLGVVIEFSFNFNAEKTSFGKQFILSFGGVVIAIAVLITYTDKDI